MTSWNCEFEICIFHSLPSPGAFTVYFQVFSSMCNLVRSPSGLPVVSLPMLPVRKPSFPPHPPSPLLPPPSPLSCISCRELYANRLFRCTFHYVFPHGLLISSLTSSTNSLFHAVKARKQSFAGGGGGVGWGRSNVSRGTDCFFFIPNSCQTHCFCVTLTFNFSFLLEVTAWTLS